MELKDLEPENPKIIKIKNLDKPNKFNDFLFD